MADSFKCFTMYCMLEAGGCGPGRPLVSWPDAISDRNELWACKMTCRWPSSTPCAVSNWHFAPLPLPHKQNDHNFVNRVIHDSDKIITVIVSFVTTIFSLHCFRQRVFGYNQINGWTITRIQFSFSEWAIFYQPSWITQKPTMPQN